LLFPLTLMANFRYAIDYRYMRSDGLHVLFTFFLTLRTLDTSLVYKK